MSGREELLVAALAARRALLEPPHAHAFRLFNGFTEGLPALALDVYADSLVVHDYADSAAGDPALVDAVVAQVREHLAWLRAAVWKIHNAEAPEDRRGRMVLGEREALADQVVEQGVRFAIDLRLHGEASLYLDTRNLRAWLREHCGGRRVLNAFAYTGSLGVAARAAGAEVLHVDRDGAFLAIAKRSYALNRWAVRRPDFRAVDFFPEVRRLRRAGELFDCVIVDPPLVSVTERGRVDLTSGFATLLNKVRPLVGEGGWLVAVNNALFVSGAETVRQLEALCTDGYLALVEAIAVPDDCVGRPAGASAWPADPSPFNHPTKIAVLRARRKDGRAAPPAQPR